MAEGIFGPVMGATGGVGDPPSAPSLALAVSGNDVIATIDGDVGVTNYLVYKASSDAAWTAAGNRAGDGDITVEDLTSGVQYTFVAYSNNANGNSEPSPSVDVLIIVETTSDLDSQLLDDADEFLDAFSEVITYLPYGGDIRQIRAIVTRITIDSIPGAPGGRVMITDIEVRNSAEDGISSSEYDSGLDKILVADRIGQDQQQRKIPSIMHQDHGMMKLEVA